MYTENSDILFERGTLPILTVFSRSVSRYQFIYTLVDSFIIAKLFKLAELYSIGHLHPCPPPLPLSSLPPFPLPIFFPFLYSTPPPSLLLSPRYFFPPLSSLFCEFPSPFIHSILPPPSLLSALSLVPLPSIPPSSHIS